MDKVVNFVNKNVLIERIDKSKYTFMGNILAIVLIVTSFILSRSTELPKQLITALAFLGVLSGTPTIFIFMYKSRHIDDLIPYGEPKTGIVLALNKFDPASIINMLSDKQKNRLFKSPGIFDKVGEWSNYYEVSFNKNGHVGQGILTKPIRIDDSLTELQATYQECLNGRKEIKITVLEVAGPNTLLAEILSKPVCI